MPPAVRLHAAAVLPVPTLLLWEGLNVQYARQAPTRLVVEQLVLIVQQASTVHFMRLFVATVRPARLR